MSFIEYQNVTKSFGAKKVLSNIDLSVQQHELVALVGSSGSGKSTMFNIYLGSLKVSSGLVRLNGLNIECVGPDRGIVPQKYSLFPHLKVRDNIAFGKMLSGTNMFDWAARMAPNYRRVKRAAQEEANELLTKLGLEASDGDKYPFELSGGMQQRVAIGSAIIMRPQVLLMDEPFGALDPSSRSMMQQLTLQLWKDQSLTVIFVTHDMEEAIFMGTRIVGLSKYWDDENGQPGDGATIVLDRQIAVPHPRPRSFMQTEEFRDIFAAVGQLMSNNRRVTRDQFDLSHPDAIKFQK